MSIQIIYLILAFIFTAFLGKLIIPILKKLKVGQSEREDGPRSHLKKQGTPTMGRNYDDNFHNCFFCSCVFIKPRK